VLFSGLVVKLIKTRFIPVFALGVVFALFQTRPASAECLAFPKLEFWGAMSYVSVQDFVETKYEGDWDIYIEKLERILKGLKRIQRRGKGAVVKLKGRRVTLRGGKLGNYIKLSGERMEIVRCLADEAEMADLQNFATAAGGNAKDDTSAFTSPIEKRDGYPTYVTIPRTLAVKLRKQAARRSLTENHEVSVNDIIVRSLRQKYAR